MKTVAIKVHEAWLELLMAGFMASGENKQVLFNFSDILFRHFTWIEHEMIQNQIEYSYDREMIPIKVDNLHIILNDITRRLNEIKFLLIGSLSKDIVHRIESDIDYICSVLNHMKDEEITAFNMKRKYNNIELGKEATDALTLFLFEETYKEYELILIYNYLKAHSNDTYLNRIFQILIDESFFHLKSFGDMSAKMGILGVPRIIMKELYQIDDVVQFLKDGIDEELAAKEECIKLAEAVAQESSSLKDFFNFINNQENYHISLMKDALNYFSRKENV